jgi:hypothetical protein
MRLLPTRRWLRFSIRTLLITVTIFCVWLGWQVSIVRERKGLRAQTESRIRIADELAFQPGLNGPRSYVLPWYRHWLGDMGVKWIIADQISEDEFDQLVRVFSEAQIKWGRRIYTPVDCDTPECQGSYGIGLDVGKSEDKQ